MEPILSARPIPNWQPSTPAILAEDFASVLGRHPAVVIHFWADWNGIDPLITRARFGRSPKQFHNRQVNCKPEFITCRMTEYANPGKAARSRASCMWVRLPPRSLNKDPVVQWHDTSPTCWRRWFNSIRDQLTVCRCCGSTRPW